MTTNASASSNLSSIPAAPAAPLRLGQETPGQAIEVAEGFWVIATQHRPGYSRHMFPINNRCLVFRLRDQRAGRPCLVVVNGTDPAQAVGEVRKLEVATGLSVRYIVSPGGGHHLTLDRWHDTFTEAQVLVPPLRIPRTGNGQRLMQLPRVVAMDLDDPLPQFRGELDAVMFHGLLGPQDHPSPIEGGSSSLFGFVRGMMKSMPPRTPVDELWLFHRGSHTVIAGENLAWQYPGADYRKQPFMARQMLKPDQVWIWTMARKVGDAAVVGACWRRILAWPARALMTYHDVPGTAFLGDGQAELQRAVRDAGQI